MNVYKIRFWTSSKGYGAIWVKETEKPKVLKTVMQLIPNGCKILRVEKSRNNNTACVVE